VRNSSGSLRHGGRDRSDGKQRALNGTPRTLGKIALANDPVAADATCARLMGFEPGQIVHIRTGSRFLGNSSPALIDQAGEVLTIPTTPFQVVPEFRFLDAL
jgi:uncharacterized protein (DUF362 family)